MTVHITFKEYLESKQRLQEALGQTPVRVVEYVVQKYCRLPVGESKEHKHHLILKPNQVLIVEWSYLNINNPKPSSIKLKDSEESFSIYWKGKKVEKWLIRNTEEQNNESI